MKTTLTTAALTLVSLVSAANAQSIQYTANDKTVTVTASNLGDTVEVTSHWWGEHRVRIELEYWDAAEGDYEDIDETFDMDEVDTIIFYGGNGDDIFVCENDDDIDFDCILIGGNGLDMLVGGPNDDYLDGGYDGAEDILEGREGADRFVRWYTTEERPLPIRYSYFNFSFHFPLPVFSRTVALQTYLARIYEYEDNVDFNSAEGDIVETSEAP